MNSRDFENCENDWLAREVARERFAGMFHTDEAERLKASHEANCDAGKLERAHARSCDADAVRRMSRGAVSRATQVSFDRGARPVGVPADRPLSAAEREAMHPTRNGRTQQPAKILRLVFIIIAVIYALIIFATSFINILH